MKVCICGGGNLGHVIAGVLLACGHEVVLLTTRPEKWSGDIHVTDLNGKVYQGRFSRISSCAEEVVPHSDIVLLCLPGFAIREVLFQIKPCLTPGSAVGSVVSSSGFFFEALRILPSSTPLFGFQRVPYIARTTVYGQSADLKGYRKELFVAVEQCSNKQKEELRRTLEGLLLTPIHLLDSYYEVALTNSNPLLHPSRLYAMWKDWKPGITYEAIPQFYYDWTDEASEYLVAMDKEFQRLTEVLPIRKGSIPPLLEYYEVTTPHELTQKLRSIPAFAGILSPMIPNADNGGYVPDFANRYFTEDIPYGMRFIVETAHEKGVEIPVIITIYDWGMKCINNAQSSRL